MDADPSPRCQRPFFSTAERHCCHQDCTQRSATLIVGSTSDLRGSSSSREAVYRLDVRHAARPEGVFDLTSEQIDWENKLVDLLPEGREQLAKKHRPVVRLPDALKSHFSGRAVSYEGAPVKSVKKSLWCACDRAGVQRCSSYRFRHTAARWMRKQGVPQWEVAAQLGHSLKKSSP